MRRVAVPLSLTPEAARPRDGRPVALGGPTMGVTWSLRAWAPRTLSDAVLSAAVQAACDTVVAQMSTWEPASDLSCYNDAAPGTWAPAPAHLLTVLGAALETAELSGGAFDPTVGPLVDLWGFGAAGATTVEPAVASLRAARVGWRDLRIDTENGRIFQPGGLRLDLAGIAKGFGVDLAARALEGLGVRDYLLEIGGELRGGGVKGDGEPWWVEIEAPPEGELAEVPILVALHGLSIATSGDWRRAWSAGGRRYSHTLDPATRAPVEDAIAAVSVLHPDCMRADALCTALTVLGPAAPDFADRHDIAAHIVSRGADGLREWVSPALGRLLD
ncbi:MAG: FAD:protein FMN transferase [Phenylobacterium sp.]|uniref:FAD:protein FMN transferase n=1 Tax=Phenylobacterium sp. TaxID=1871053 RepID=UPI001222CA1F|nr:FAD:protein FMN transferase [Phenylobacterium sp.]TAJ74840.1 MAG: FAD:protein FMN transferase [Phenylobacterium sp.]